MTKSKIILVDSSKDGYYWKYYLQFSSGSSGTGSITLYSNNRYGVHVPGLMSINDKIFKTKSAVIKALKMHVAKH